MAKSCVLKKLWVSIKEMSPKRLVTLKQRRTKCDGACGKRLFSFEKYFLLTIGTMEWRFCEECREEVLERALKQFHTKLLQTAKEEKRRIQEEVAASFAPAIKEAVIKAQKDFMYKDFPNWANDFYTLEGSIAKERLARANEIVEKTCPKCHEKFKGESWKTVCVDCFKQYHDNTRALAGFEGGIKNAENASSTLATKRGMTEQRKNLIQYG